MNEDKRGGGSTLRVSDNSVKLVKGGVISGSDKSTGIDWPNTEAYITYGSAADLWGQSWGFADINASGFGFVISAKKDNSSSDRNAEVDHITITVYYTPAPTGTITITKNAIPDDAQDFHFTTTGAGLSAFDLDDDANGTLSNTKTFTSLATATYSVTETTVGGWDQTSAICSDGSPVSAINLSAGETVTCTFTNTKKGHLIVQKTTFPEGDQTQFSITASGSGTITGGGAGSVTDATDKNYEVTPGAYSVAETVPVGWDKVSGDTCQNVEIAAGETKTCLFINVKRGHIVIVKDAVPNDAQDFSFTNNFGNDNPSPFLLDDDTNGTLSNVRDSEVLPGTYAVSETVPDGWDQTSATCDDNSPLNAVEVSAGEIVTCTFTNTKRASLSVTKISDSIDPDSGSFSFQFDLTGPAQNDIPAQHFFNPSGIWPLSNLLPGLYLLSETIFSPLDWTGSRVIACNGDGDNDPFSVSIVNPLDFTLHPGENMSCTVNNTQDAVISGKKFEDMDADGIAGNDQGRSSGWAITTTRQDDPNTEVVEDSVYPATTGPEGEYTFRVPPGTYKICEVPQEGWFQSYPTTDTANSTSCGDGGHGYDLTVVAGDNKNGNDFGNYQNGSINGYKWNDLNGDGVWHQPNGFENEPGIESWKIYIDTNNNGVLDDGETWKETGGTGYYSFDDLIPGTYVIREVTQEGWTQTYPENAHIVVLSSGEESEGNNFGNFHEVTITGLKWDDTNGDGIRQQSESGQPGVTMEIRRVLPGHYPVQNIPVDTEMVQLSLTGADGVFIGKVPTPGNHIVVEQIPSGSQQTFPVDSFFDIFVDLSGQTINTGSVHGCQPAPLVTNCELVPIEFGNHLLPTVSNEGNSNSSGGGGGEGNAAYNALSDDAKKVDANKDGKIDILDLNILFVHWGETGGGLGDFNGDGVVDILDFGLLMLYWTG